MRHPELTLVNTNRMQPPIAPVGLDYIAATAQISGIDVEILDLCFAEQPVARLREYFARNNPFLAGITLRNIDDCFWPSAQSFVGDLLNTIRQIRDVSQVPIVVGGVGFSIAAQRIFDISGADFGIHGDGETSLTILIDQIKGARDFTRVPGLLWRENDNIYSNPPAWPDILTVPPAREAVDNRSYLQKGGQIGLETKRGCPRQCVYCADPLAKGKHARMRSPAAVAEEAENLLRLGIDVLHLCDGEFNLPREHAAAVCEEFIRRDLGEKLCWYAYLAIKPFDADLARLMKNAGCVGINFTGDSAHASMLRNYRQHHQSQDIAHAVCCCRENGIEVMIDLLLGGPGETPQSAAETINFMKKINPDCVGAGLGLRVYDQTAAANIIRAEGPLETNPSLKRKYPGPVDLLQPTFYISASLGEHPAELVRDLIDNDPRFFEPEDEYITDTDHNYNDNPVLTQALAQGYRGAYWHILSQLRSQSKS